MEGRNVCSSDPMDHEVFDEPMTSSTITPDIVTAKWLATCHGPVRWTYWLENMSRRLWVQQCPLNSRASMAFAQGPYYWMVTIKTHNCFEKSQLKNPLKQKQSRGYSTVIIEKLVCLFVRYMVCLNVYMCVCMKVMYASHVRMSCTYVMYESNLRMSGVYVMYESHLCTSCMKVIYVRHVCMKVMYVCHVCVCHVWKSSMYVMYVCKSCMYVMYVYVMYESHLCTSCMYASHVCMTGMYVCKYVCISTPIYHI